MSADCRTAGSRREFLRAGAILLAAASAERARSAAFAFEQATQHRRQPKLLPTAELG